MNKKGLIGKIFLSLFIFALLILFVFFIYYFLIEIKNSNNDCLINKATNFCEERGYTFYYIVYHLDETIFYCLESGRSALEHKYFFLDEELKECDL